MGEETRHRSQEEDVSPRTGMEERELEQLGGGEDSVGQRGQSQAAPSHPHTMCAPVGYAPKGKFYCRQDRRA